MQFIHTKNKSSTILDTILSIVFPIRCVGCKKTGEALCCLCVQKFPPAQNAGNDIFPIFDYKDATVRRSIISLKYHKNRSIAAVFGKLLYEAILEEISEQILFNNFENPVLIPIPITKRKKKERGYNQSELLAENIYLQNTDFFSIETSILEKCRDTESQTSMKTRGARLTNPQGSFAVSSSDIVAGKNIIIIDDVVTTGATISEAKKVLKSAGAKQIIAFTVAH